MVKHDRSGDTAEPVPVPAILAQVQSLRELYRTVVAQLAETCDGGEDNAQQSLASSAPLREETISAAMGKLESSVAVLQTSIRSHIGSSSRLELIAVLQAEVRERQAVLHKITQMTTDAGKIAGIVPSKSASAPA